MKITGHGNRHSIKSYLQIDSGHQQEIIEVMRSVSKSSQAVASNQTTIIAIVKITELNP